MTLIAEGTISPDKQDTPDKIDINPTTLAVGEEGDDGWIGPPEATTLAIGEEDDGFVGPPEYTTHALGEEGGDDLPDDISSAVGENDDSGIVDDIALL
jgi:hypothetical protein